MQGKSGAARAWDSDRSRDYVGIRSKNGYGFPVPLRLARAPLQRRRSLSRRHASSILRLGDFDSEWNFTTALSQCPRCDCPEILALRPARVGHEGKGQNYDEIRNGGGERPDDGERSWASRATAGDSGQCVERDEECIEYGRIEYRSTRWGNRYGHALRQHESSYVEDTCGDGLGAEL